MKSDKTFFSVNNNGNLCFNPREDNISRIEYKPDNIFEYPVVSYGIMMLCALLDLAMFYQLFSSFLYDNLFFRLSGTLVAIIGFDIGPIYLANVIRRHHDGYRVGRLGVILFITAFITAFLISAYLRIKTRDLVLPSSALTGDSSVNPTSVAWCIFGILAPVVTSFVSFAASYYSYHPLRNEKRALEQQIDIEEMKLSQFKSILLEYEADKDFRASVIQDENSKYLAAARAIQNQGVLYCNYVRERLKEQLGEPSSTNELSKSACLKLLNELDETRNAILEIAPPETYSEEDSISNYNSQSKLKIVNN